MKATSPNGLGSKTAKSLGDPGLRTGLDLLQWYPRRYLDRTNQADIASLRINEEALVLGRVKRGEARRTRKGKALVEVEVPDGTGYLKVSFFNQAWRAKQLHEGTEAAFFGKIDLYRGRRQMTNPVVDLVGDRTGKIVPLYPQSDKAQVYTWELATWVEEALRRAGEVADPLPERWQDELDLVGRDWAVHEVHAPEAMA